MKCKALLSVLLAALPMVASAQFHPPGRPGSLPAPGYHSVPSPASHLGPSPHYYGRPGHYYGPRGYYGPGDYRHGRYYGPRRASRHVPPRRVRHACRTRRGRVVRC